MANPDISLFVPPPPDPARSRTPEIRQPPDVSNDYTGYPALPSAPSPYGAPHPTFPSPYFPMEAGMYHGGGPPPAWMIQPDPFGHPFGHPRFQQYGTYQPQAQRSLEPPKVGDRVDPFMAGNHYGPVLEPFLLLAVGAQIKINPLIQPPEYGWDKPYLRWNMLFPSTQCQKSTDDLHASWHSGRHEPATFPRITFMRIVSEVFPWIFTVHAKDLAIGVTCGDVIDTLAEKFSRLSSSKEYEKLPPRRRNQVAEAYSHNRAMAYGVPGNTLGQGMRRLDFLCKDTMYGGIVVDEEVLKRVCEDVLPCSFVLCCLRRYALTQDEILVQEARDKAAADIEKTATASEEDD